MSEVTPVEVAEYSRDMLFQLAETAEEFGLDNLAKDIRDVAYTALGKAAELKARAQNLSNTD